MATVDDTPSDTYTAANAAYNTLPAPLRKNLNEAEWRAIELTGLLKLLDAAAPPETDDGTLRLAHRLAKELSDALESTRLIKLMEYEGHSD